MAQFGNDLLPRVVKMPMVQEGEIPFEMVWADYLEASGAKRHSEHWWIYDTSLKHLYHVVSDMWKPVIVTYHSRKTCDSTDVFILRFGEAGEAVLQASLSPGDFSRFCRIFEFRTEVQTGHGLPLVGRQDLKELSNRTLQKIFQIATCNFMQCLLPIVTCSKGWIGGGFWGSLGIARSVQGELGGNGCNCWASEDSGCIHLSMCHHDLSNRWSIHCFRLFPSRPMVKAPWHGAWPVNRCRTEFQKSAHNEASRLWTRECQEKWPVTSQHQH